ncbi:MAG: hypothetical protein ACFFER_15135, partial [Candidatus Thorarchaeota archaeon]
GKTAIERRWKSWIGLGIAKPISVQRGIRAKSLFSLSDFGLELPVLLNANQNNDQTQMEEMSNEQRTREDNQTE